MSKELEVLAEKLRARANSIAPIPLLRWTMLNEAKLSAYRDIATMIDETLQETALEQRTEGKP